MVIIIKGVNIPKVISQLSPVCRNLFASQGNPHTSAVNLSLCRSICSKANRDPNYQRKPPFPYQDKKFNVLRTLFDKTSQRFDENSKIIVVDGAIAAGKSEFAKQLADELDMLYMKEANMDMILITAYGYDLRQLDPQLPESVKSFDIRNFCENPRSLKTAGLQCLLYKLKYDQYIDALAHVMNTGQGVVMDKSVYSDYVFVEALVKCGFMSKQAQKVYYTIKKETIDEFLRPHLAIYLDMPVEKVQEKIKQRGRPHEVTSEASSTQFLQAVEDAYKRLYLKEISSHANLLIYDWSDGGDVEVVVEDIERLNFDDYDKHDEKMKDWRKGEEKDWTDARLLYTNYKDYLMRLFNMPLLDAPELIVDGNDFEVFEQLFLEVPGNKYQTGFNKVMGDTNILFKKIPPKRKYVWY